MVRLVVVVVLLAVACTSARAPVAAPAPAPSGSAPSASGAPSAAPTTSATPAPAPTPTATPAPAPTPTALPDDPAALAAALTDAERAIRSDGVPVEALADAGARQQIAYRRLARDPALLEAVLASVPADLHAVARANAGAGAELRGLVTPQTTLPAWRIVAPAPAGELRAAYDEAEAAFGVPWAYLAAIHLVETRMGRIRGTSTAGAQGPMQFIPETWAAYGEGDINDNRDAILAAGRYLAARGAPGDMDAALYAYNPSRRYVRAVRAYAETMLADPRAYAGYYHWQVYYATAEGDVLLPVGYGA
jgi:membrane-bound lytic murein transglycosylase B